MKIMWFTLWSEPAGVGEGVGVGSPELRPSPAHPVRRSSDRKARTHVRETFLQRVIWGPTWRDGGLHRSQETKSSSSLHPTLMCSLCAALAELDLPSFDIPSRCSDIEAF